MTSTAEWRDRLRGLSEDELIAFLTRNSGLPGPRGNLELADAFTATADPAVIRRLADDDDEYLRFCGTQALGRLLRDDPADRELLGLLRARAVEERWRIREATARALQVVGDSDRVALRRIVADWADADDPYLRRAAVAAICEPRLLTDAATRAAAIRACATCTSALLDLAGPSRRTPAARTLRQALGYCWSVAITADPDEGFRAFATLEASTDPDAQWIVRNNLAKKRLHGTRPASGTRAAIARRNGSSG